MSVDAGRWRVMCIDLDGTLVRGTTVCQYLADTWLGHGERLQELEQRYRDHEISNGEVADEDGRHYAGRTRQESWERLNSIPCIDGIQATVDALHQGGLETLLGTVTWRFAAEFFGQRHGFAAVSGTEMGERDGLLDGSVVRYFDEIDKVTFLEEFCDARGVPLSACVAVGDSRSDVPLFQAVGFSVALNASREARAAASVSIDADDLTDVLGLVPGLTPPRRASPSAAEW